MRSKDAMLALLVPLVVGIVASIQIVLAFTAELTPWRGGAFAMFASPDHLRHRAVVVVAETDVGEVRLDAHAMGRNPPEGLGKTFPNAMALPSGRNLERKQPCSDG